MLSKSLPVDGVGGNRIMKESEQEGNPTLILNIMSIHFSSTFRLRISWITGILIMEVLRAFLTIERADWSEREHFRMKPKVEYRFFKSPG
jgi:hypothetical protein